MRCRLGIWASLIPRPTMRTPSFDRITSRPLFTLFLECEDPPINFIAKLTVSGVSQTMIRARCRAPACLVYLDPDRIADAPPPLNTPQHAFTFSLPILPTYSALFTSHSFFLLFRLFLFHPSCLLLTTATTTRARPRARLLTEVPQVAPFALYLPETSTVFSVDLSLVTPLRLPHRNPKTPLKR